MGSRVFISSTSEDLADYRQAAIEICNTLQLVPVAMEFFSVMGTGATEGSKRSLEETDVYVGIFAHRYGYIESGFEKSVTEIEFDYADELELERLCFLVDPTYPWPPDAIDHTNHAALRRFKEVIDASVIRGHFTTVSDFRVKLFQALVDWRDRHAGQAAGPDPPMRTGAEPSGVAPPLPSLLVGREEDLLQLRTRIGTENAGERGRVTIVRGWPGVGKTTLVTALARDSQVIKAFSDGILWAAAGETPEPLRELQAWVRALGGDPVPLRTLEDAMRLTRDLLRKKSVLLIVDDVWEADAAHPFRVGGPGCATLVTTRFVDVAREMAVEPDDIYLLDRLSDDQGVELLAQLMPSVSGEFPAECRRLVAELEGLPLALRVAARTLENEAAAGFDVRELFHALSTEADLLDEKAPEDRFDPQTGTTPTIRLLLEKSTDRLEQEAREAFAFLGAFAPKPATFDLEAIKAVWEIADVKPIVLKLVDRGLLEPIPSTGRFWMHAILVKHATQMLGEL